MECSDTNHVRINAAWEGTVARITRPSSHRWQSSAGLLIAAAGIALLVYVAVYI